MEEKKKSGFATASLVLSIIGICTSFIPIINNLSFIMGVLAIIFSIVSLVKKASIGKAITSLVISIIAIFITIYMQKIFVDAVDTTINDINNSIDQVNGNSTEEILSNCADVVLGQFEVNTDEYGLTETRLVVKVTNKTNEMKSFSFQIEAVNVDGSRLAQDYVYANNLNAGQSQEFEIFNYVQKDKLESMKNATINIVEASMF